MVCLKYRKIARVDLKVSEIGFGAWTIGNDWWGRVSDEDACRLVKRAIDLGINFFDTADVYGDGRSEKLLGEALKGYSGETVVATKFGYDFYSNPARQGHSERPQNFAAKYIRFALENSLKRLNRNSVDLYQLHNPKMECLESEEVFRTLDELRKEGKIRHYGVALGPAIGWRDEGLRAMKARGVASVQTVYNILEQDPAREFFPLARELGIGILVRVPLASGALTGKMTANTRFDPSDHRSHRKTEWIGEALEKVDKLRFLTDRRNVTLSQAALRFALSEPSVASVLPNVTSLEELDEYVAASGNYLDSVDLMKIQDLYEHDFYIN